MARLFLTLCGVAILLTLIMFVLPTSGTDCTFRWGLDLNRCTGTVSCPVCNTYDSREYPEGGPDLCSTGWLEGTSICPVTQNEAGPLVKWSGTERVDCWKVASCEAGAPQIMQACIVYCRSVDPQYSFLRCVYCTKGEEWMEQVDNQVIQTCSEE